MRIKKSIAIFAILVILPTVVQAGVIPESNVYVNLSLPIMHWNAKGKTRIGFFQIHLIAAAGHFCAKLFLNGNIYLLYLASGKCTVHWIKHQIVIAIELLMNYGCEIHIGQ